jgi:hypothetical protein
MKTEMVAARTQLQEFTVMHYLGVRIPEFNLAVSRPIRIREPTRTYVEGTTHRSTRVPVEWIAGLTPSPPQVSAHGARPLALAAAIRTRPDQMDIALRVSLWQMYSRSYARVAPT